MKYAILAAIIFASPARADDCQPASNLHETYISTLNFVLAFSESCSSRPTTTCAEVLAPLEKLIENLAKDDPLFVTDLKSRSCN